MVLKPGFHAQNGSTFHAFIKRDCARPSANVPDYSTFHQPENLEEFDDYSAKNEGNLDELIVSDSITPNKFKEICLDFTRIKISNKSPKPSTVRLSNRFRN